MKKILVSLVIGGLEMLVTHMRDDSTFLTSHRQSVHMNRMPDDAQFVDVITPQVRFHQSG